VQRLGAFALRGGERFEALAFRDEVRAVALPLPRAPATLVAPLLHCEAEGRDE
jgi:hypothetical protein